MGKITKFICEDCGKNCETSKIKKPNVDTGKLLCQKCSTKYTNRRSTKRKKNSKTIKARYDRDELDYMRDTARKLLINRNKTWLKHLNSSRNDIDAKKIADKKLKTWLKRSKSERDTINHKRTSAFRSYNNKRHNEKINWFNSLTDDEKLKVKNYRLKYNYLDKEWDSLRKQALKDSNYRCECCGKKASLDVHHAIPFIYSRKHEDLYALCRSCHAKIERRFDKAFYESSDPIFARNYSLEIIYDKDLWSQAGSRTVRYK